MKTPDVHRLSHSARRPLLVALALLALCLSGARAQDQDDDGVLPGLPKSGAGSSTASSGGTSGESVSGTLGLAGPQGLDLLDPREARLVFACLAGPLMLDDEVDPQAAAFLAAAPYDFTLGEDTAVVQGTGQLVLQPGLSTALVAADEAVVSGAFLVLHGAGADLSAVLSGAEPAFLVIPVGDLPSVDLAVAQAAVSRHADVLAGLEVSVVQASVDSLGEMHLGAVRFDPVGSALEVLID